MSAQINEIESAKSDGWLTSREARGEEPVVLSDIYDANTNIAVWKRMLNPGLEIAADEFVDAHESLELTVTTDPVKALSDLRESFGKEIPLVLAQDIATLTEMFCLLFDIKRAGLRLRVLDRAMCPRFHTDKVPCRLVCTYRGIATEWLPHDRVNREHLGPRDHDASDLTCGLYRSENDIRQLERGDVALLKGELWQGNSGAGLVHRSPTVSPGEKRLLLSIDYAI